MQAQQIQCQIQLHPQPCLPHSTHHTSFRDEMLWIIYQPPVHSPVSNSFLFLSHLTSGTHHYQGTAGIKAGFGKKDKMRAAQSSHRPRWHILHPNSSTPAPYLLEVVLCEFVSNPQQFTARVSVSKSPDAQAIGRVQLSLEELAAGLLDLSQLEKASSWQQGLDISLFHSDLRGVGKVDEQLHGPFINVPDHDLRLPRLCQLPSEHGSEVGAAGWQDYPVGIDLLGPHYQHHIAEFPVLSQQVDDLQGLPRVLVGDVGHARGLRHPFGQLVGISKGATAGHVHSGLSWASAGTPAVQEIIIQDHGQGSHCQLRSKALQLAPSTSASSACKSIARTWKQARDRMKEESISNQSLLRSKQMPTCSRLQFIAIFICFLWHMAVISSYTCIFMSWTSPEPCVVKAHYPHFTEWLKA